MRLRILGSGSSSGTPAIGQGWGRCDPQDPRNRRLRPSVLIENGGGRVLVDTSPDLRQQLLGAAIERLDGVILTHVHADHVHGIDDLRAVNRAMNAPIDLFGDRDTLAQIAERFGYVFEPLAPVEGKKPFYFKPVLIPREVAPGVPFRAGAIEVRPFAQDHGVCATLGLRFGPIAYSTDVKALPEDSFAALEGVAVWVIGVLADRPHPTHAHVDLALEWVRRVRPGRAVLTGLGLGLDHETLRRRLPAGVEPAYDGMVIEAD